MGISRGLAAGQQFGQVVHVVVVDRDEQPVVLLEGPGSDLAQEPVLLDALDGRVVVVHRVAGAAVEQSVVAPRRARR